MREKPNDSPLFNYRIFVMATVLMTVISATTFGGGPISHFYYPEPRTDTVLTLNGPNGLKPEIATNDDTYPGSGLSRIVESLSENQSYYIQVTVFDNPDIDDAGPYLISVNGPGGNIATSPYSSVTPLTVNGVPVQGNLPDESAENWFIFQTADAGEYTIETSYDPTELQPGQPIRWRNFPVPFNIDRGVLGDLSEEQAVEMVRENVAIWNGVSTTRFRTHEGPRLDSDFERSLFTAPSSRYSHQLFYDPNRNNVLLYGGFNSTTTYGDLWEWNGGVWSQIVVDYSPPVRDTFGLAYDKGRNQHVLFGGYGELELLDDTWTWDGESWNFRFPTNRPSPRSGHAMAYDEVRQEIVLFGGADTSEIYRDTWIWNGDDWRNVSTAVRPPARAWHRLFYDPVRETVVLFGGYDGEYVTYDDMWEWDGSRWKRINIQNGPSARDSFSMTSIPSTGETVIYGGLDESGNYLSSLWIWNGASWRSVNTNPRPSKRQLPSMAYDEDENQIVLFGGEFSEEEIGEEVFGDTWLFNGDVWTQASDGATSFDDAMDLLIDQGFNPIILDGNGDLTDLIGGLGAREDTLDFGAPWVTDEDEITTAIMVLNGWFLTEEAEDRKSSLNELSNVIAHEFGHFIGLGHSQFYTHQILNRYGPDDDFPALMFPLSSVSGIPSSSFLRHDDIVALSDLYPAEDDSFAQNFGTITGRAVFADGTPVLGGIVIARSVADRSTIVVSRMTDELSQFNGDFRLPGLPPGQYEVWIEPDVRLYVQFHPRRQTAGGCGLRNGLFIRASRRFADVDFFRVRFARVVRRELGIG